VILESNIERALAAHPGIAEAAAFSFPAPGSADTEMVVALRPAPGGEPPSDHVLLAFLRDRLPDTEPPKGFYWTGEWPADLAGDVLAWWSAKPKAVVAHGDEVTASWCEVLGPPTGDGWERTGFVSAGGNSLRAARLVGLLARRLSVTVPLSLLLRDNATPHAVREFVRDAPRVAVAEHEQRTGESSSPLAPEQRRLWLHGRMFPDSAAYNVLAAVRLTGRVNVPALRGALADLVGRHDILRAHVVSGETGEPEWRYAETGALPLVLRKTEHALSAEVVHEFLCTVVDEAIPDAAAPLARATLLRTKRNDEACLAIVFNHLIADQATVDLVLRECAAAYSAAVTGADPLAPGPAPSYAAYATREHATRDRGHAGDLEYWRARLAGVPVELPLPFRRRRPDVPDFRGAAVSTRLSIEDSQALDLVLRERGLTAMSFFLACVGAVLSAWSGHDDVVLGVPVSRRDTPEKAALAGFLLDTLPVRLTVSPGLKLDELAAAAQTWYAESAEHRAATFDAVIEHLGVRSRPGRNPFFQTWVNDLTDTAPAPAFAGLDAELCALPMTSALFDLNWYLWRRGSGYELQLVRDVGLFSAGAAEELVDQVTRVAARAVTDLDQTVESLCAAAEQEHGFLDPEPAGTGGQRVVDDVLATAARYPTSTAVVGDGRRWSYAELAGAVRDTASALRHAGVAEGAVVEIGARRCLAHPVAVLGAWAAGACPVLLDGATPDERVRAARVVTAPAAAIACDTAGAPAVSLLPARGDRRTGASHVLLTSGSAGRPRAVEVPHGPLRNFLAWYVPAFGIGPGDRVSMLSGPGHDPVLRDILAALTTGAELHVPPERAFADPSALAGWLAGSRITVAHVTPPLLEMLVAAGPGRSSWPDLRLVVSAGAPLGAGLARRFREISTAVLVNAYGTTETPQIAACATFAGAIPADLPDEQVLPVGRGVAGHQVRVLRPDGSPAAPGQRGEIVVRGRWLASGYLGQDEHADGFQSDPAGRTGVRVFRTGDLGHLDLDGRVVVAGRDDRQVSVDGFRLELGEVEHAALAHAGVRAALAGVRDTPVGQVLTLQVVTAPEAAVTGETVRGHLARTLPRHGVPAVVDVVDRLGLTTNHKPAPAVSPRAPGATSRVDWLAALAEQVLGHPIGLDDNLFDAGMSSVTLVRFHEVLTRELRVDLPVTTLFVHVTLRALSRHLESGAAPAPRATATRSASSAQSLRALAAAAREVRKRVRRATDGTD